ncbi:hypothetical protein [Actibacterium lipolyticum]|uniref:Uncharacterized protein n=1 Tax=Actibacterium lipolyticum TaxID=1524263 RepID=A0A238JRZ9_9RHOB|nr:hypothetical protein [Actibacterium lipolyticum]SMX33355.1 hypothetical protein COL8621_01007 [Actibacterium lipolyticum]
MTRAALFLCVALVSGCTDFPDLDAAVGDSAKNAAYPRVLPIEGVLENAAQTNISEETGQALADRAAALRQKARALTRPILTRAERRRLTAAVERHQQ